MRIGSVQDWAREHDISRQAAYKRIREHGIPFTSPGRLDLDVANQVFEESVNPAKQRGGEAGGAAAVADRQAGLFGGDDDEAPEASIPNGPGNGNVRSMLGRAQLQREVLRIRRERMTLEVMEGKLVPLSDVRAWEAQMITTAKSDLVVIGSELCDELAGCSDPIRCRELVDGRVNQALRRLSQWEPTEGPA